MSRTLGKFYDLDSLYRRLNRMYFDSSLELEIRWGRRQPSKAKTSIQLGSYDDKSKCITISRRLDNPKVPLYFLEHVIFHEMLHAVFPREKHRMHTQKFKTYEKMHPDYGRALEWEKENLKTLFDAPPKSMELFKKA